MQQMAPYGNVKINMLTYILYMYIKLHVNLLILHVIMSIVHVNIIMLYESHVNIIKCNLFVDIIHIACIGDRSMPPQISFSNDFCNFHTNVKRVIAVLTSYSVDFYLPPAVQRLLYRSTFYFSVLLSKKIENVNFFKHKILQETIYKA